MSTESRAQAALRNSLWNVIGYVVPTLIALFVTPAVVLGLGAHEYGMYAFMLGLLAIISIIDLGFPVAASRLVTEYFRSGQKDRLASLMATSHTVGLTLGLAGFLGSLFIGPAIYSAFVGNASAETTLMFGIIGAIYLINTLNFIYSIVPSALERFDVSSLINIIIVGTSSVATLFLVLQGFKVVPLLLVQLIASLITSISYIKWSKNLIRDSRIFGFGWSKEEAKKCYIFGIRIFLAYIGNSAPSNIARMVIPIYLSPAALTYYSVPANVTSKVPGLIQSLSTVLFPVTTHLAALGEKEKVRAVYIRSLRLMTVVSAAISLSVVFFSDHILKIWISDEFARESGSVITILAASSFFLALFGPLSNFLTGLGKVDMLKNASLTMAALNTILLVILLPLHGIQGAAWAFLAPSLLVGYMIYHTERHYLEMSARVSYYAQFALKLIITGSATWAVAHFALLPITQSLFTLITYMSLSIASFVGLYYLFGFFEKEDIDDMKSFFFRIFKRLSP